ncbi:MAG TPA: type IV toxin-antitoxin system AbiEi family antitoxin domain-containing protein [Thermoanaerobaculia bacterium]|jgi:predicted transcriptional regulator of viral defense system
MPEQRRTSKRPPPQAIARSRELERRGFSREELRRLSSRGVFERGARGIYLTPDASRSPHRDLLIVATRVPHGVFCLFSALAFHGLTTEMPHEVWVAIGLKSRTPATDTPPVRSVRLSEPPLHAGIEIHTVHGVELRVFSVAKTVADCFKFRSRVGTDVAVAALREGWMKKRFTMDELWQFARVCRVTTVMRPYLEALIA